MPIILSTYIYIYICGTACRYSTRQTEYTQYIDTYCQMLDIVGQQSGLYESAGQTWTSFWNCFAFHVYAVVSQTGWKQYMLTTVNQNGPW